MKELISEILTMSVVFACIGFYAIWRSRKAQSEHEISLVDRDKSLFAFAREFDTEFEPDIVNFKDLCDYLAGKNLILKFSKKISQKAFVALIKEQNLKQHVTAGEEAISQDFISLCVRNLNPPLALGFYIAGDEIFAFLCEEKRLFRLIDLASRLGEDIIICD